MDAHALPLSEIPADRRPRAERPRLPAVRRQPARPAAADAGPRIRPRPPARRGRVRRRSLAALLTLTLHGALALAILHAWPASPPSVAERGTVAVTLIAAQPAVAHPDPPAPAVQRPPRPVPPARVRKPPVPVASETAITVAEPAARPDAEQATDAAETNESMPAPSRIKPAAGAPGGQGTPAEEALLAPRFDAAYLNNPAPAYPLQARRRREQGEVRLQVTVGADGLPGRILLVRSSGSEGLDRAAREAVAGWRFVPARRGERNVEATVMVPVVFKLGVS